MGIRSFILPSLFPTAERTFLPGGIIFVLFIVNSGVVYICRCGQCDLPVFLFMEDVEF